MSHMVQSHPLSRRLHTALLVALLTTTLPAHAAEPAAGLTNEIIYRASLGSADDISLLIKQGASPDQQNRELVPVLLLAAARKDPEGANVVQRLIDEGANINITDNKQQTALFYAARSGNIKTVQALLDAGISYYAQDANGDVARNIAFRSGHEEAGNLMDGFVAEQTKNVQQQYSDANKILLQRYEEERKRYDQIRKRYQRMREDESAAASPSNSPSGPSEESSAPAPSPAAPSAPPEPSPEPEPVVSSAEAKKGFSDLAFSHCAFQYWSYVSSTGQSSELSEEAIDMAIEEQKEKAIEIGTRTAAYPEEYGSAETVADSARKRIYNELNVMPSKTVRHEKGVGKKSDMQARCTTIARRWDTPPPEELAQPTRDTVKGGGGGVVGMPKMPKAGPGRTGGGDTGLAPQPNKPAKGGKRSGAGGGGGVGGGGGGKHGGGGGKRGGPTGGGFNGQSGSFSGQGGGLGGFHGGGSTSGPGALNSFSD